MAIYSGFSSWKWWFSIAMLVYQRVRDLGEGFLICSKPPKNDARFCLPNSDGCCWVDQLCHDFPAPQGPGSPGGMKLRWKFRGWDGWNRRICGDWTDEWLRRLVQPCWKGCPKSYPRVQLFFNAFFEVHSDEICVGFRVKDLSTSKTQ